MSLRKSELKVGRRVMVPPGHVPGKYPWAERYGTIVEIERFHGLEAMISVRLDGESAHIISCKLVDLDHE